MTAAVPAIAGVFSPRSENTNIPATSAGPTRRPAVPAAMDATAPAVLTAARGQGGQGTIKMTAKLTWTSVAIVTPAGDKASGWRVLATISAQAYSAAEAAKPHTGTVSSPQAGRQTGYCHRSRPVPPARAAPANPEAAPDVVLFEHGADRRGERQAAALPQLPTLR